MDSLRDPHEMTTAGDPTVSHWFSPWLPTLWCQKMVCCSPRSYSIPHVAVLVRNKMALNKKPCIAQKEEYLAPFKELQPSLIRVRTKRIRKWSSAKADTFYFGIFCWGLLLSWAPASFPVSIESNCLYFFIHSMKND